MSTLDVTMTGALVDVMAERERQKLAEGWTYAHDDAHTDRSLAAAASCYAYAAGKPDEYNQAWAELGWRECSIVKSFLWPANWNFGWWKPKKDRRRNLVIAAALLLAEIERGDRLDAAFDAKHQ